MSSSFQKKLSQLGFASYDDYLHSDHWKLVKQQYRESGRPIECLCCKHTKYQLHHITYVNLGKESLDDLVPLCKYCHKQVHKMCKKHRIKLIDIHEAIKAVRRGDNYIPPTRRLTRNNSTKSERRKYARRRKREKQILRDKAQGLPGQVLIQCPECHRRAWQDGPFCCMCGTKANIVKQNN